MLSRRRIILVVASLCSLWLLTAKAEVLWNDSMQPATGLRVVFDMPVEITGYGDILLLRDPAGASTEFVFSGNSVAFGYTHWLTWVPAEASVINYEWIYSEALQHWTLGFGFQEESSKATTLAQAVRFVDNDQLRIVVDTFNEGITWSSMRWSMLGSTPETQYLYSWSPFEEEPIRLDSLPQQGSYYRGGSGGSSILLNPTASIAVATTRDATATLFEINSSSSVSLSLDAICEDSYCYAYTAFSPSGERLAIMHGTNIGIWDANSGTLLANWDLPEPTGNREYREVGFSPDNERIFVNLEPAYGSGSVASIISIFDLSGHLISEIAIPLSRYSYQAGVTAAIAEDSLLVLRDGSSQYVVDRFDSISGERLSTIYSPILQGDGWWINAKEVVALSGGSTIAVAGDAGRSQWLGGHYLRSSEKAFLHLFDVPSGRLLRS